MVQPPPRAFDSVLPSGPRAFQGIQDPEEPKGKVVRWEDIVNKPGASEIINAEGGVERIRKDAIARGYTPDGFPDQEPAAPLISQGPAAPLIPFEQAPGGGPKEEALNSWTMTPNGAITNASMLNVIQRKKAGDALKGRMAEMPLEEGVDLYLKNHINRMQEIEGQYIPDKTVDGEDYVYRFADLKEQYGALGDTARGQVDGLLSDYNERWEQTGRYYSDFIDFTAYVDPQKKVEKIFGMAAQLVGMRWSKDPREKEAADDLLKWVDGHGGHITTQFHQVMSAVEAQRHYDTFGSIAEEITAEGNAEEITSRLQGMLGERPVAPQGHSLQELGQYYNQLPIEDDTNNVLVFFRAQVEKKARINGVAVEEVGKWPVTKTEAWDLLDETITLFSQSRDAARAKRAVGSSEGIRGITVDTNPLTDRVDGGFRDEGWRSFLSLLTQVNWDPEKVGEEGVASVDEFKAVIEGSLSGEYTNIKDVSNWISIPLKILELAVRPTEGIGTTIDALTMDTSAVVGYMTTDGVFGDFWEYLDWAMWNMQHNPNTVFQEDKTIYDYDKSSRAEYLDEAGLLGGAHRLMLRGESGYEQLRGLAPNYEEGAFPIKPTIIRGTDVERVGKPLFEAMSDGWSAFTGETEGVYIGQALLRNWSIDSDDRVGNWSKTIIGLGFDIAMDPISWLTGGQLNIANQLSRRVKMFNALEKTGQWSDKAKRAWAGVRVKAISEGKKLPKGELSKWLKTTKELKDLGLKSFADVTDAAWKALQFKKHLSKLPKVGGFKASLRVTDKARIGEDAILVRLGPGKSKNASELVDSLGGAGLKPGHMDELKAFGADEVMVVFNSAKELKDAVKAKIVSKEAAKAGTKLVNGAVRRQNLPNNARILGSGKGGHGRLVLKSSEPLGAGLHSGRRIVTMEDGTHLNPELVPAFETVKAMFNGNDDLAKWMFGSMKNNPRFRRDGLAALLDNKPTLEHVRTLLKDAGVNVAATGPVGLEQTKLILNALNEPIEKIVAFRGSGLNLTPKRLRSWLAKDGKVSPSGEPIRDFVAGGFSRQAAWRAGFDHTPKLKLWKFSTAPVSDPLIGAFKATGRVGRRMLSKMDSITSPVSVKTWKSLINFVGLSTANRLAQLRAGGLTSLQANRSRTIELESLSRLSAEATPGMKGKILSSLVPYKEVYDMPFELHKSLLENSLKLQNREKVVREHFIEWAVKADDAGELRLLGGSSEKAQAEIYESLSHMVEAANYEEGLAQLALARKFDSGEVYLVSKSGRKEKITLGKANRWKDEKRERAIEAVGKALDDVDIENARKLMEPYKQQYLILKEKFREMGEIGEKAGILASEERYAPHLYQGAKATEQRLKKGGISAVIVKARGASAKTRMSGHGIERTGPPTILEAQIYGFNPVTDMRHLYWSRANSFYDDLYRTQLLKEFSRVHGVTPVANGSVAAQMLESAGKVGILEQLAPVAERAKQLGNMLKEASRAKRDLNKTQAALNKQLEKMGLSTQDAHKVIDEGTFDEVVELLTPKGKAVGTRETLYRTEAVGVEAAGDSGGVVFFSPDKSYVKLYESEGRVGVSVPKPDEVFDIRVPSNEKIVRKWLKEKLKKYSGNEDVLTKDLKQLERSLEIKGPQGVSGGLANVSIIENTLKGETAPLRSGSGERLFMDAHDIKAMTVREAGRAREEYSFALTPAESTRLRKATKGKATKGAPDAARADAELLRDVFTEIDKRTQALNQASAKIAKDFDMQVERVLNLLDDDIPAFLKGQRGGTKAEETFIEKRIAQLEKTIHEVRAEAGGVGVEVLEAEKGKFVLHQTRLQELRAGLRDFQFTPREESAVMMTLYGVPSASFLSIEQAEKFLAAGKVSIRFWGDTKSAVQGAKGLTGMKHDRVYRKHYIKLLENDIPGGEAAEWAKALENVYIPVEDAMLLHGVGVDYGISTIDKVARAGAMHRIAEWTTNLFKTSLGHATSTTKTLLTAKNPALHFGRRNQWDMVLKLTQASAARWLHPEIMSEFTALMQGELTIIRQSTGGIVDAKKFMEEAESLLASTWGQQVNVRGAEKVSRTSGELKGLTGSEKVIEGKVSPVTQITGALEEHVKATSKKPGMETVMGVGISAGLPGPFGGASWLAGLAVTQKGTPGLKLPSLTEWIFPWGTRAAEKTDNTLRAYLAFLEVKKGSGINQAMHNALDLGRNYDNLTPFERNIVAQGPVMFYNFMKQNLKSFKHVLLTEPGRATHWPKLIAYVEDEVPDSLKQDWASALGMIYTKDGGYFIPTDMDALGFFDFIPSILSAAGKKYIGGDESALRRTLDLVKTEILSQSSPIFAALAAPAVGEIPMAARLGSNRFSKDTQRKLLAVIGKPEEERWLNHELLAEVFKPDGRGGYEVRGNAAGLAFKALNFVIPFAQLGNNLTRNRMLEELPDGHREFAEKFGLYKKYDPKASGAYMQMTGIAKGQMASLVDALAEKLPFLGHDAGYPQLLSESSKWKADPMLLKIHNILMESGQILKWLEERGRMLDQPTEKGGTLPGLSSMERREALMKAGLGQF